MKNLATQYQFITKEVTGEKKNVGLITLNRPKALNALNKGLMTEVAKAITEFETDRSVGAIVITGNEKAFAAGADIKEMQGNTYSDCIIDNFLADWTKVANSRKPTIAAVNGLNFFRLCNNMFMMFFFLKVMRSVEDVNLQ